MLTVFVSGVAPSYITAGSSPMKVYKFDMRDNGSLPVSYQTVSVALILNMNMIVSPNIHKQFFF